MPLIVLILICSLFYAGFEILASLAGGKINNWLAATLYNGIGTFIPLAVYFFTRKSKTSLKGIAFAALAGVAIMLFSVLLAHIFNRHGNLSYVIPIIYGIAIVISSLYGILVVKDRITALQLLGILLVVIGVGFISFSKHKAS